MCVHCIHVCELEDKVLCCKCYKEWYSCDELQDYLDDELIEPPHEEVVDVRSDVKWVEVEPNQWIGTFSGTMYDCMTDFT